VGFRRVSRDENGMFVDRINDAGRVTSTISYGMGGVYVDPIMYGGFNEPELPPEPVAPPPVVQGPVLPGQSVEQPTPLTSPLNLPLTPPVNIPATPADPEEDPEAFAGPGTAPPVSNVPSAVRGWHTPVDDFGLTMDPEMIGTGGEQPEPTEYGETSYWTDSTTGISYQFKKERVDRKWWPDTDKIVFDTDAGQQAYDNRKSLYWGAASPVADLEKVRLERELEAGESSYSIRFSDLEKIKSEIVQIYYPGGTDFHRSDFMKWFLGSYAADIHAPSGEGHLEEALGIILDNMPGVLSGFDKNNKDDLEKWLTAKDNALGVLATIVGRSKEFLRQNLPTDKPWAVLDKTYKLSPFWTKEVVSTSFPPDLAEDPRPDSDFTPSSYSSVPWSPIYQDFLNDKFGAAGSPAVFKYHSDQGLSNDPLQRTTYTQFLTQATEDDPWGGKLEGGHVIGAEPQGGIVFGPQSNIYDQNRYNNFLQTYVPLTGDSLTGRIGEIIDVVRQVDSDKPGGTWDRYDPVGVDQDYSSEQLQAYRWRHSFFEGPRSVVNQKALAALPIMQNTHPTLRNETSKILHRLHNDWLTTPDKDPTVSWLEYVHENDYFGMIPTNTQIGSGLSPGG